MVESVPERLHGPLDGVARLAPLIREHAERSERESQLATEVVEAFHEAGLFRVLLPLEMKGSGLTIPETLRVYEAVARIDGSCGWNLAICADGPVFGHFLPHATYDEIFGDPRALIGGSLNPMSTRAVRCDGGWRFSGKATFVSGSAQLTWVMSSGIVFRDGAPEMGSNGIPVMRSGVLPKRVCTVLDTWSVSGMRGTGSNDCAFEDVFVPDAFTFDWPDPRSSWQRGAFAAVPLVTQLGGGLASVALGIAQHAIDALVELATTKVPAATRATLCERPLAQIQVAQAEGLLQAGRAYLWSANEEAWRRGEAGAPFGAPERAAARLASVTAAKLAAQAVDLVYDAAGATSIQKSSPIERCWRDVHAVTQHVILSTGRFEIVGRVLFGLDPGAPII
ncbi:MAG TPA: acyl-CoA dehydrogenase family protein [Candidatus Eisenbacteria bacterium]|nr:acyl-CoA dehydrogenase family protein [Candidatus Eisenbacteria bacterium]